MMIFDLPTTIHVHGVEYKLRTDYRDVLTVLIAFEDPELSESEKAYVCMTIMLEDFETIPREDYNEAFQQIMNFIDRGENNEKAGPRTMDWEQDAQILFPAINKVAGYEVREAKYIHWWTFMGYFMEINEGVFSTVLSLRQKKAKGKKLEKWEREWWQNNSRVCKLHKKYTDDDRAEQDRLKAILG